MLSGKADESPKSPPILDRSAPTYIAGHRGLVGSAIWRHYEQQGFSNLIGRTREELDLLDRGAVFKFFDEHLPRAVVLAAAKVGGIHANNTYPADFISQNLQIQTNILDAALKYEVPRLLFLGSSCIYPKHASQPISEESLLTGELEPTNDAYAIAKIAGIIHVQAVRRQHSMDWISAMPTNLYGPGDNFSSTGSHVLPALIRRYDEAVRSGLPEVTNWGSGLPRREFLHVDDLASASLYLLDNYNGNQHINVGTGEDHSLRDVADMVADAVAFSGDTRWDTTKPDGTPRKLLDVSRLRQMGWTPKIKLRDGIDSTVGWYRSNHAHLRM